LLSSNSLTAIFIPPLLRLDYSRTSVGSLPYLIIFSN
jgi:hypothetical protein